VAKTRPLVVTVLRKGNRQDRFEVEADPRNPAALKDVLTGWLSDNGWSKGRWGEFTLDVREADSGPRVKTSVRAA
jgi:hypothetical protein